MKRYEVRAGKSGVVYWKCDTLEAAKAVLAEHGKQGDYIQYKGRRIEDGMEDKDAHAGVGEGNV